MNTPKSHYSPLYRWRQRGSLLLLAGILVMGCDSADQAKPDDASSSPTSIPSDISATPDEAWWPTIEERVRQEGYRFKGGTDGIEASVNGLVTRFDEAGLRVAARDDAGERIVQSDVRLRFAGWGRPGRLTEVSGVRPALGKCRNAEASGVTGECIRRLERVYPGITEWWENGPKGLEQGWTVEQRPTGEGQLELQLAVDAASIEVEPDRLGVILEANIGNKLRYDGLKAWDADGKTLHAKMSADEQQVAIRIDDSRARYPVTVDPVLSAAWTVSNPGPSSASFGMSVSGAGDVNGDGYDDVIVGAPQAGSTNPGIGRAYVFLGSPTGLSTTAHWVVGGGADHSRWFGRAVSDTGDVNGDGYDDVIVGDSGYDDISPRAYIYLGSVSGLDTTPSTTLSESVVDFGRAVSSAGDVDNDGFSDVIVAGWENLASTGQPSDCGDGTAFVYLGSPSGASETAIWSQGRSDSCFGMSASGAGDVNGDGYDDVIVGAPGITDGTSPHSLPLGRAYLYLGSATGPRDSPSWSAGGSQQPPHNGIDAFFAQSVSDAGDVNGDGFSDVIVASEQWSSGGNAVTRAYVFLGSTSGLSSTAESYIEQDHILYRVAGVGDIDDDGYDDVAGLNHDEVWVHFGSAAGIEPFAGWTANTSGTALYQPLLDGAGDVNADDHADIILGLAQNSPSEAKAYYGARRNDPPLADDVVVTVDEDTSVVVELSALDADGDALVFAVEQAPEHGTLGAVQSTGDATAEVTYTPDENYFGSDSFEFRVTDTQGESDTGLVEVFVDPVNDAPEFVEPTPEGRLEVAVGDELSFVIAAEDPEDDPLTYGVDPLFDDADFDAQSGEFRWTARVEQAGEHTLELTADDGETAASRQIEVAVDAPDTDGDGVPDALDACPDEAGDAEDGCPAAAGDDVGTPDAGTPDAGSEFDAATDEGHSGIGEDNGGCGCTNSSAPSSGLHAVLGLLVLLGWRQRRRIARVRGRVGAFLCGVLLTLAGCADDPDVANNSSATDAAADAGDTTESDSAHAVPDGGQDAADAADDSDGGSGIATGGTCPQNCITLPSGRTTCSECAGGHCYTAPGPGENLYCTESCQQNADCEDFGQRWECEGGICVDRNR